ncbi:MAG: hypothetical protein P4L83_05965 [Nevskia sp.]|nr:hypothetical protein [Nevskia sp.]
MTVLIDALQELADQVTQPGFVHRVQLYGIDEYRVLHAEIMARERAFLLNKITVLRKYFRSQDANHSCFAQALPRQSKHQCIELRPGQADLNRAALRPAKLPLMQAARHQPDADSVMNQHLYSVTAAVGEQVGMVRPGGTENLDDARQCCLGAGAHAHPVLAAG